jgi:mannose-6-phosphate isomerase-like protein (cupin superfamily)
MFRTLSAALFLVLIAFVAQPAVAQQSAPVAPATYVSKAELMEVLKKSDGTPQSDVTVQKVPAPPNTVLVNIGHRTKAGATMSGGVHPDLIEVYHIIEGTATVTTGGTLVKPAGADANARPVIQGGKSQRVTVGDVVVIPINTPHTISDVESTLVFLNIRINPMK